MTRTPELEQRIVELRLDEVAPAEWNYKLEDIQRFERLRAKLQRLGQIVNIVVRELPEEERKGTAKYEVVDGNHRLQALRELGVEYVWAYNLGRIGRSEAMRISLELNEDDFEPDTFKLAHILSELTQHWSAEDLVQTLPYTEDQLARLTALVSEGWEQQIEQFFGRKKTEEGNDSEEGGRWIAWGVDVPERSLEELEGWVEQLATAYNAWVRRPAWGTVVRATRGAVIIEALRRAVKQLDGTGSGESTGEG